MEWRYTQLDATEHCDAKSGTKITGIREPDSVVNRTSILTITVCSESHIEYDELEFNDYSTFVDTWLRKSAGQL